MPDRNVIKCRFCEWECRRWYHTKEGKTSDGYKRLRTHVAMEHPEVELINEEEGVESSHA